MKKVRKIIVFAIVIFSSICLYSEEVVEAIVAVVNDDLITLSEYKNQYNLVQQMLRSQFQGEELSTQLDQYKKIQMEQMITDLLLLQEAKSQGINVAEDLKNYIEKVKNDAGLSTADQLKKAMAGQGIDFDSWRAQQENQFLRQRLIFMEVGRNIVIDDSTLVEYYNKNPEEFTDPSEVTLKAIYLSTETNSENDINTKKSDIDTKIAAGETFGTLAGLYSDGPGKEANGDLGNFKKGELEASLEQAVEKIKVKETTPWLKVTNGWYLLFLEEKKESVLLPFVDVRDKAQEKIFLGRQDAELKKYMDKLKDRGFVKILIKDPIVNR